MFLLLDLCEHLENQYGMLRIKGVRPPLNNSLNQSFSDDLGSIILLVIYTVGSREPLLLPRPEIKIEISTPPLH